MIIKILGKLKDDQIVGIGISNQLVMKTILLKMMLIYLLIRKKVLLIEKIINLLRYLDRNK